MVLTALALTAGGLVVSVYLLVEHLTAGSTLACPETTAVNCARVTTSEQATVIGVPWAALGVLYFAVLLALVTPAAWGTTASVVHRARLALATVGALSVLYLIFVELFIVNAICLWCTFVHIITLGLFGLIAVATARWRIE